MNVGKKAHEFLGKEAPIGYVAGLGRGGVRGFVTGSDVVPIQPTTVVSAVDPLLQEDAANLSNEEPDEAGLLSTALLTAEDREAIEIYDRVSQTLASRNPTNKRKSVEPVSEILRLKQEFSSLKKSMATVTAEEWADLPDAVNIVGKRRKEAARETFVPLPDELILGGLNQEATYSNSLSSNDVQQFREAREKALSIKLEKASQSFNASEDLLDSEEYLASLSHSVSDTIDLKRARALYRSITNTSPESVDAWIAFARIEEKGNNMKEARKIVRKGIEKCKKSNELWVELVRLHASCKPSEYDATIKEALAAAPRSAALWLIACEREQDSFKREELFRKGLELNPKSVELWKAFIETEDTPENAKILLQNAVECVPECVDFWIALAKLETCENAKRVLNKARINCPKEPRIWIEAMKLEESRLCKESLDNLNIETLVDQLCGLAGKALVDLPELDRNNWIDFAMQCERDKFPQTSRAIINSVAIIGMENQTEIWKATWLRDIEKLILENCLECARAMYDAATRLLSGKKSLWKRFAAFEQEHGTFASFEKAMNSATVACPNVEILWLIYAKHAWNSVGGKRALEILQKGLDINASSEGLILAKFKVLCSLNRIEEAEQLLTECKDAFVNSPRIWMKLIVLKRNLSKIEDALSLLGRAIVLFPKFPKFYLINGQILSKTPLESLHILQQGTEECPECVPLWIELARQEQAQGRSVKSRSVMEKARLLNPKNEQLWVFSIELEKENANQSGIRVLLTKALKECPLSGLLHYHAVMMEAKTVRLAKATEYLKKIGQDPWISFALATVFAQEHKVENAIKWYQITLDNNSKLSTSVADFYLYFYAFLIQHSRTDAAAKVKTDFLQSNCVYGPWWIKHRKEPENWLLTNEQVFDKAIQEFCSPLTKNIQDFIQ